MALVCSESQESLFRWLGCEICGSSGVLMDSGSVCWGVRRGGSLLPIPALRVGIPALVSLLTAVTEVGVPVRRGWWRKSVIITSEAGWRRWTLYDSLLTRVVVL